MPAALPSGTIEAIVEGRHADPFAVLGLHEDDGALVVRVTAAGEATRLAAVERLVERAAGERPRVARVADQFRECDGRLRIRRFNFTCRGASS